MCVKQVVYTVAGMPNWKLTHFINDSILNNSNVDVTDVDINQVETRNTSPMTLGLGCNEGMVIFGGSAPESELQDLWVLRDAE
jgi:hypothetical protein